MARVTRVIRRLDARDKKGEGHEHKENEVKPGVLLTR